MDRRKALKNMGLAMGYTIATPTLLGLVQSCKSEAIIMWNPEFFSQEQVSVLSKLVDIILPITDTPSATEVQVDVFVDRFAAQVMDKEKQNFLTMSMAKFTDKALADSGKSAIEDLTAEELEPVLAAALKVSKQDKATYMDMINTYNEAVTSGQTGNLEDGVSRFAFADNLRGLTIWGYKTSEYVGEEVLAYLPVPGEYVACGDLNELTGGKDWSL